MRGDSGHPDRTALDALISQLRLGMPLFFVLSGFLVFRPFAAAALERRPAPDAATYLLRRAARIVPAYWFVILTTAIVLAWVGHGQAEPIAHLPVFLLFLQNYVPETLGRLNPPTWTIVVEVSFYLFVPLIAALAARATTRIEDLEQRRMLLTGLCVVLILIGTSVLGASSYHGWGHDVTDTLPARMASFGAGMLVAVLTHGRSAGPRVATGLTVAGIAFVLLEGTARSMGLGPLTARQLLVDTPASLGFGLIVAGLVLGRVPGAAIVSRGPLRWYGTYSYGLYLWHFPVIFVLRSLDRWPSTLAGALLLTMAISTLLAFATWHLLERPAIAWARRRMPSRSPRRPALATGD